MFVVRLGATALLLSIAIAPATWAFPRNIVLVNLFSDDPATPHDPRHVQEQSGEGRAFAPIGQITTNQRARDVRGMSYNLGTAFLVSPCYVMSAYHVVFGDQQLKPDPDQDYAATFHAGGRRVRAVPVKYGDAYRFHGRDWVLLRLDSDDIHPCLGENPDVGWLTFTALPAAELKQKTLSIAGYYPSDKGRESLWRQDECHFYDRRGDIEFDGVWTTDCATLPGASGSPIILLQDGVARVVGIMHGHVGAETTNVFPSWDPAHANLALDLSRVVASDPDVVQLIADDISRFAALQAAHDMPGSGDSGLPPLPEAM